MDPWLIVLFVPACFALNVAPGPSNLLSLSNGTRYGFGRACLAGGGRLLVFLGMTLLAAAGLTAVLNASETLFQVIRAAGAAYLLVIALRFLFQRTRTDRAPAPRDRSLLRMARNELVLAAGNPKAIVLFTALVPQFVDTSQAAAPQFAILAALFLLLEWLAIAAWAGTGAQLPRLLGRPGTRRLLAGIRRRVRGTGGRRDAADARVRAST